MIQSTQTLTPQCQFFTANKAEGLKENGEEQMAHGGEDGQGKEEQEQEKQGQATMSMQPGPRDS